MQGVLTAKKENAKQFVEASEIIVNLISTCFQDRLVMTTSISFRLYKIDLIFPINFIYYILNKNKNQMIGAFFLIFLSIAEFYNFVNNFNELIFQFLNSSVVVNNLNVVGLSDYVICELV